MRVTIIRSENSVNVNGERRAVDCSALAENVHVVQWNDTAGEIEYRHAVCDHCGVRSRKPNDQFTVFSPYMQFVTAWRIEGDRLAEVARAAEQERQAKLAEAARNAARSEG